MASRPKGSGALTFRPPFTVWRRWMSTGSTSMPTCPRQRPRRRKKRLTSRRRPRRPRRRRPVPTNLRQRIPEMIDAETPAQIQDRKTRLSPRDAEQFLEANSTVQGNLLTVDGIKVAGSPGAKIDLKGSGCRFRPKAALRSHVQCDHAGYRETACLCAAAEVHQRQDRPLVGERRRGRYVRRGT